jgi:hypothetical protein
MATRESGFDDVTFDLISVQYRAGRRATTTASTCIAGSAWSTSILASRRVPGGLETTIHAVPFRR